MDPIRIKDKLPAFSKEKSEQFTAIMDGFSKNASSRFSDPELIRHIDRIEAIYIESGRYLELTKLYEDEYTEKGKDAKMIDRLAFAYIRLGQDKAARDLLDEIGEIRPGSADLHFLEGSFWMRQPRTIPNLTNALKAWVKVLELEPDYVGFERMDKRTIQPIIDRLRRVVPADKLIEKVDVKKPTEIPVAVEKKEEEKIEPLPEKEVPEKEVKGEIKPEANPEEVAPEKVAPPVAKRSVDDEYLLKIAMAEIAVSEGNFDKGDRLYEEAKVLKPDGFEAEFGPLRSKWRFEPARNKISVSVRKLALRKLNAKQAYQVGLFVFSNMNAKKLARDLFESVQKQDPDFAKEVGLEALLVQVK